MSEILYPPNLGSPAGPIANRPAASDVPHGTDYFANNVNGGTLYRQLEGSWVQIAAGLAEGAGVELARTELTASPPTFSGAGLADVPGLTIMFQTFSRPAIIHAVFPQCGNSIAGSGGRLVIHDGTSIIEDGVGDSGVANGLFQVRVETKIPANTALKTYKVQAAIRVSGVLTLGALGNRKIKLYAVTC